MVAKIMRILIAVVMVGVCVAPTSVPAANHREAPITAIDRLADITDFFAFVSYNDPSKVTLILNVDPLLEPANGPNYFPFDPNILYVIRIDNDHDAVADVRFQFRFHTEIRAPGVFTGFVGAGSGINAPANSPPPVAAGTPIIPPAITALNGPGSEGLSLRQSYTVTMVRQQNNKKKKGKGVDRVELSRGKMLFAVPSNVGPRTMPFYASDGPGGTPKALAAQGIYSLGEGIRVFAGTVDDPFWIDLGAAFDSLNFRATAGFALPGVLTDAQDADDTHNFAADDVAGYNVNCIAIEVPIAMLTSDGAPHPASDREAVIGAWGTTSRQHVTIRRSPHPLTSQTKWQQVQRMGNPLINELVIGTGSKDRFSMDQPRKDSQFAKFFLDPLLARVLNAIYEIDIPTPPRTDLLPLVTYAAPICPGCAPANAGPVADLLRLNTGIPPTPAAARSRLGFLTLLDGNPSNNDPAGFPNGRRVSDDVTDIAARAVAGILASGFNKFPYNRIGDGVNANDLPYQETFPYVAFAHSGRNSRHVDPGEPGGGPVD
ncbi:MAG: DUF4331 domain-containing protein [Gammaproteobacteria bacterium]